MSMVERMARAMFPHVWAANMEDPRRPKGLERDQEAACEKARAALYAIREPTEAMCLAGIENCATSIALDTTDGRRLMTTPFDKECGDIYRAMIDAALKDEA